MIKPTIRVLLSGGLLLLAAGMACPQVVIEMEDIPNQPGTVIPYYQSDRDSVQVDLGHPGADREWDFTGYIYDTVADDSLLMPENAPHADSFPEANRVSRGGGIGLGGGRNYQYQALVDSGLYLMGISLGLEIQEFDLSFPVVFPSPMTIIPFPCEMGEQWSLARSFDYYLPGDSVGVDTVRLEFDFGGQAEADGWGTVTFPGGEDDALRIHNTMGLVVNAYLIQYLFGQRVEIPVGEVYSFEATHSYHWIAPGRGELATISSRAGEEDGDFEYAASVRVQYIPPEITFTGDRLDFGEVAAGDEAEDAISVENNGTGPARITSFDPDDSFENPQELEFAGEWPIELEPGEETELVITWRPETEGLLDGFIYFHHNDPMLQNPFPVEVSGRCTGSSAPELTGPLPDRCFLAGNYPNPFNPVTTIRFGLDQPRDVTLTVHTIEGRSVARLVDGMMPAGVHEVEFSAEGLASGIYLYTLESGDFQATGKMLLVR